jgi:hypothetical protein
MLAQESFAISDPTFVIRGTVDEDAGINVRACEVDGNNRTDSAT